MANIEINVNNKQYTSSKNNNKLIKTNVLKENSSASLEEMNLNSETYNVESTKIDTINTDSANENYNMSSSEIESLTKQLKKVKKEYIKNYEDLEAKYTDSTNNEWYQNETLVVNSATGLAYTPEEYKNLLMTTNNIITEDELAKNKALKSEIDVYSKAYEKQFEQIMGTSYSEYKELKSSYKSDLLVLESTISSLGSLAIQQKNTETLNTDSFKSYISNRKKMTFDDLEKIYNDYSQKTMNAYWNSNDITESAQASIELYDNYNPMYLVEYAEKIAENQKLNISEVFENRVQSYQYDLNNFYKYYKVMTEDEKNLYSYYFETDGRESAEKYFNDMKDSWNQRIAYNEFQESISNLDLNDEGAVKENIANTLKVNVDGIGDGILQFMNGIANSIANNKEISISEYKTMYYLAYLEQNSKILSTSYQVGTATGNMLPSITASILTAIVAPEIAPKVGQTLIGVSAYGNSKHSALVQGSSLSTSVLYGLMSASSEVLFEKFGGIIGIADNAGSRLIFRTLKEGIEEGTQSYVQAGIDALVLGKEVNLDDMNADAKQSFLIGMLVAAESNLYSNTLSNSINLINNGEKITISKEDLLDLINDKNLSLVDKNSVFINDLLDSVVNKFKSTTKSKIFSKSDVVDNIINNMYEEGHNGFERLVAYYNSGNIEYIPENLRSTIEKIPKNEISNYLNNLEVNSKNESTSLSLDKAIITMNKEGYDGWNALGDYYTTGNVNSLSNSVRASVTNIPKEEIANFLASSSSNYKYGTNYSNNIGSIVTRLNNEGYIGWNILYKYAQSGDLNTIPKSFRSEIIDIPKNQINDFLSSKVKYSKYAKGLTFATNIEEFESGLQVPITDANIKKMVEKTYMRDGYNEYQNFVTMQTEKIKQLPTEQQINHFLNRFTPPNYVTVEQGSSFLHIRSDNYRSIATKRLYINSDYDTSLNFMEQFATKCEQKGIPFYFKTANFKREIKPDSFSLVRDESVVIYAADEYFLDYVNICDEIKRNNPDMEFLSPPIFTGVHNNYLGYGAEPTASGVSFNSVRTSLVMDAIKSSMDDMQKAYHTDDLTNILNNANLYQEYRNRIYQKIYKSAPGINVNPNKFYANYGD